MLCPVEHLDGAAVVLGTVAVGRFFDAAFVGQVAQHGLERGAVCILEPEGTGDFTGADVAGFLADEGKHVFFAGKGVLMWL